MLLIFFLYRVIIFQIQLTLMKIINHFLTAVPNVTAITVNQNVFKIYPYANASKMPNDYPDIELVLGVSSLAGDISGSYRGLLGLTDEFYEEVFSDYKGFDSFMIVPVLLRPKSRGRLTLRNNDPYNSPIVDINYYDHEDDLNTMVQAIKIVRKGSLCINILYIYLTIFLHILFAILYNTCLYVITFSFKITFSM